MLSEKIIGSLESGAYKDCQIDYVDIEWHEVYKKLHKKTTQGGKEIGIRMDNDVLIHGLMQDDVIYQDGNYVVAVNIPPCEVILVQVDEKHNHQIAKVCYEIGNKHASLFFGDKENEFITPYNEPTLVMLNKLHGVYAEVQTRKLDFKKAISSTVHNHTH